MENEKRKLASIQRIRKVIKHPNADRLDVCTINDWTVVSKIGEFKEGDLCCFFEIDSFLPDTLTFNFLGTPKTHRGVVGHRLRTSKIRNIISQGLALPLTTFPEIHANFNLGDDVTELLKIIKYEPEDVSSDKVKTGNTEGRFPSFIQKTDQERIQNLPHYYEMYKDHLWEETLKLDGSSLTVYKIKSELTWWKKVLGYLGFKFDATKVGVCSRNIELKRSDNYKKTFDNNGKTSEYVQSDFWKIVLKMNLDKKLPIGYALQGELIGPKIQSNHEKVSQNQFWIFDVYDIKEQRYMLPIERREWIFKHKLYDLNHAPVTDYVKIFQKCKNLDDLQKRVTGESINPGTISEGRVYKSCTIPGLSFKCVSNEYLLKEK